MVTGFDILTHDRRLRRHWLLRSGAFIADAILVFVPVTLILWFAEITDIVLLGLTASLVFYLSSSAMEAGFEATAGKFIFGLRARSLKSDKVSVSAFIRNINRLLWFVLPPLDFALGMATRGDPRQRLLDRAAGTTVVIESERHWHEAHLETFESQKPADPAASAQTPAGENDEPEDRGFSGDPGISTKEDKCHQCGGRLIMLADEKLECEKCGLIQ